jgi:hypothetical protein
MVTCIGQSFFKYMTVTAPGRGMQDAGTTNIGIGNKHVKRAMISRGTHHSFSNTSSSNDAG